MSASKADERTTRSWRSGTHCPGPGSMYVSSPSVEPVPNRGEEETLAVAGIEQGGHTPDVAFVVKRDSTILRVCHPDNGAPGAGEVGRSIMVFFAQEHSAHIIRSFENVFALGEPQSFVCRGNFPNAVGGWYHCRVIPNHGECGVESATVFARDITEWKQREEELSRFRAIINHAGEAIFVTDAHTGRLVDVNETACHWLGISRERLLQMGVGDLNLEFPLESGDGVFDHIADTRDSNRPQAFVRGSHRRRNGTSFPVEVALSQQHFGDRDFLLVVARDVKQRSPSKQALQDGENERRGLFAISRDAGYCTARDGTVSEINDSAVELFGYTRGEFLGLEARRLYRFPECIGAFQRAVEEDGSVKNFRAEFQTKTGQSFHGFLGATLRYDSDGNVLGYQCFVSPVGETTSLDSRDAAADTPPETHCTDTAQDEPASDIRLTDADASEREAERVKREIEEARAEAAKARLDAEHGKTETAIAKLAAGEARERADALEREAERSKREIERARSEAATARADAERAVSLAAKAKLAAARAEAEAQAAQSEIEKAKLEVAGAKLDAEQARSETAKAMLDADEAKERAQQLKREADNATSETQKAVVEAANAWAELERAEREARATKSPTRATKSDPIVKRIGSGTRVHEKRRLTADTHSTGGGEPPLLTAPAVRHRRRIEPLTRPGRQRRKRPAVWLAVAVIAVAGAAAGLLALSSVGGLTGNRAATVFDSSESANGEGRSPEDSITLVAPGSEGMTNAPVESTADSTTA